jgi:hypothetical protein
MRWREGGFMRMGCGALEYRSVDKGGRRVLGANGRSVHCEEQIGVSVAWRRGTQMVSMTPQSAKPPHFRKYLRMALQMRCALAQRRLVKLNSEEIFNSGARTTSQIPHYCHGSFAICRARGSPTNERHDSHTENNCAEAGCVTSWIDPSYAYPADSRSGEAQRYYRT